MSGKEPKAGQRRRPLLTDDDRALWHYVASRLEPARGKSRVRDVEPDERMLLAQIEQPLPGRAQTRRPAPPPAPATARQARPQPQQKARPSPEPPKLVILERRKARRIARGNQEIEARLDLHGMTQDDAHSALVGFVRRCHAQGLRTVLVITGKGGTGRGDHDDVVPRPRGVLRRNVPRWLAGPEIGSLVVSYATAHLRHGGEGALYVRLRRHG
jgi:DNA-nicking Smr family endonuclease